MDIIEAIAEDPNSQWFEKGTYQADTNREIESINIYNEEANRVVVFKRSTGEFVTFCQPTSKEYDDLMETSNFGGRDPDQWFSSQAKNLPPQQNIENEMTPVNSFESNVLGVTLIDSSEPDWQI